MKPAISITSKAFRYTPSFETDIRKRFAKVYAAQAEAKAERDAELAAAKARAFPEPPRIVRKVRA